MNQCIILAQGSPASKPAPGSQDPPSWINIVPIILLVGIMYVFMFRNQKGKDKGRTDLLSKMKKGDEVQTIGGIIGKIIEVRDSRVLVKVDENSNTKIWFSRNAIHRVLTEEKAEAAK